MLATLAALLLAQAVPQEPSPAAEPPPATASAPTILPSLEERFLAARTRLLEGALAEGAAALEANDALSAKQLSIYALLKKMSMGQKVALAVKGNREVRNILIRETNKMLCLKVLENPRIGDGDVEAYAKSTNISEDVLRGIANNKEWCKKYPIVKALVLNPKAPLGVTLDFIKRLTLKDLEQLSKNRNVPETLRSAARRIHALKRDGNR